MIRKEHFIIIYLSLCWPFTITPYINSHYHSDTDLYPYHDVDLFYLGFGSKVYFESNHLKLASDVSYNFFDALNETPNKFNSNQGFVDLENNEGLSSDQFNYFFTKMNLNFNQENFNLFLGLNNPLWGLGVNKIIISDKAPPFFNIGYKWKISEKITYEHLYGKLNSQIVDSLYSEYYTSETSRSYYLPRIINAHKIDYIYSDNISLGLFEIIIYGGNRSVEPYYLLPFVPFLPIQTFLGDIDNDMLGGYFNFYLTNDLSIYSTLLIDEWTPPYTFNPEHKNWFIYQFGINHNNLFFNDSNFIFEYIWSDNRVYNHKASINNAYSNGYPLGFWAGPHAEQFYISYSLLYKKIKCKIEFFQVRRGEAVLGYFNNFIDRFSNIVEKKQSLSIRLDYKYNDNINFNCGYAVIDWDNAGFNPLVSDNDMLNNLTKKDIRIGFNYSFNKIKF